MDAISVENLTKYFGRTPVLQGIEFAVPRAKFVALTGANGSGKSTLLSVIAGLLRPDSGSVSLGGYSVYGRSTRQQIAERHKLQGYQGQRLQLYAELSIRENLLLAAAGYGLSDTDFAVGEALKRTGLEPSAGKLLRECSQGIARRAALARAILHQPKVLLLDEPFASLDRESQQQLSGVIRDFVESGAAVLAAVHEMEFVQSLSPMVVHIEGGRLHAR